MTRSGQKRRGKRRFSRRKRSLTRTFLDYGLMLGLFGLLTLLAARMNRAETQTSRGFAHIVDGDSITLGAMRIRLVGIDAPEYRQICRKSGVDYACGKLSRDALVRLTAGQTVVCNGSRHDRYGRLLAECTANGVNLNRAQIAAGWAVAYGDFQADERRARQTKAGIWAGAFERPQDWRREKNGRPEVKNDSLVSFGDYIREIVRIK